MDAAIQYLCLVDELALCTSTGQFVCIIFPLGILNNLKIDLELGFGICSLGGNKQKKIVRNGRKQAIFLKIVLHLKDY